MTSWFLLSISLKNEAWKKKMLAAVDKHFMNKIPAQVGWSLPLVNSRLIWSFQDHVDLGKHFDIFLCRVVRKQVITLLQFPSYHIDNSSCGMSASLGLCILSLSCLAAMKEMILPVYCMRLSLSLCDPKSFRTN